MQIVIGGNSLEPRKIAMRIQCTFFVVALAFSTLLADDDARKPETTWGPPSLGRIRSSEDGKSLRFEQLETRFEPTTTTRSVPQTRITVVDGTEVESTVLVQETSTSMRPVLVSVIRPISLDGIELRTVKGAKYKTADIPAAVGRELKPAIILYRRKEFVDGKEVLKPIKFEPTFLTMFRDETLILILPEPEFPKSVLPGPIDVTPVE